MFKEGDWVEIINPPVNDPLRCGIIRSSFKPMFHKPGCFNEIRYRVQIRPDHHRAYDPHEIDFITVTPYEI